MRVMMECPDCGRRTVWLSKRNGDSRVNRDPSAITAVNRTGICYTDHRIRQAKAGIGEPRHVNKSGVTDYMLGRTRSTFDTPMTEEEIAAVRERVKDMWRDRRARGIPREGKPVHEWARGNGGLYASEIH